MLTVKQLKEKLEKFPDDTPVVNIDSRSGVVNELNSPYTYSWRESDNDYGVELPVGAIVAVMGT